MFKDQKIVVHSAQVEEEPAADYELSVNGQPVFTYRARVSAGPINQVWPGYQRPLDQTEIASFATWDMTEPVDVGIVSNGPLNEVRVRPSSLGIEPHVDGNKIHLTVSKPGQLTVEVNGTHHALHLFANPPEDTAPDFDDPNVMYFGPGVHCPGLIRLESNQTVYIAGGAVVYGAIIAEGAENIAIIGRGILDGSKFDRKDVNSLIFFFECTNVRIDGITLRDSSVWTVVPVVCSQVNISNVKLIGNWRYNSDGIDFFNCRSCSVEDSFLRTFDDSICLKGYDKLGPHLYQMQLDSKLDGNWTIDGINSYSFGEMQQQLGCYACNAASIGDINVRRCVIWNDWGRALEIGAETVATEISDILFEDCDIIHSIHVALDVQNTDRARCRNIVFRNIRVELDDDSTWQDPKVIVLEIFKGWSSADSERGHIEDIQFKDIEVTAWGTPSSVLRGYDDEHLVQRVSIENLRINGQVVTSLEAGAINANEFVQEVSIKANVSN